ncbi:MAG: DUF262 domain-containing protein [Nitrospira sp.]
MGTNNERLKPLSLKEIAAWQVLVAGHENELCDVLLPALQRGAVWKPYQVEQLWDSLLREFPIGSFLLARFDPNRGAVKLRYSQCPEGKVPQFHLLDGQQRANAIALAFLDPWKDGEVIGFEAQKWPPAALWIDLHQPDDQHEFGRQFIFRVVTRSHPWGYKRDKPRERLSASDCREAIKAFKESFKAFEELERKFPNVDWKPGAIPLPVAWPWDAKAPVPVNLLIEAVVRHESEPDVWSTLKELLANKLPYWKSDCLPWMKVKDEVTRSLEEPTIHMSKIMESIRLLLKPPSRPEEAQYVALIVPDRIVRGTSRVGKDAKQSDPIETLFERVNAGGTRLEGEELIFSIFKSTWTDAQEFVQRLSNRVMQPSRLVVLTARVVFAHLYRENKALPGTPGVGEFRQWMLKEKFFPTLKETYFLEGRMEKLLKRAVEWLALQQGKSDFGLPPTLVTTLARSSPDLLLLLLIWIDRHMDREGMLEISAEERKTLLAALTTLHWFAIDLNKCIKVLWQNVDDRQYWRQEMLKQIVVLESSLLIARPLPPDILAGSIQAILFPGGRGWAEWLTENWKGKITFPSFHDVAPNPAKEWYLNTWESSQDETNHDARINDAWRWLVKVVFEKREFLLYAQRHSLGTWFPWYDPALPDQLEDFNRPWDYDHILPSYYIAGRHNIPPIIRDLAGKIGNLRAWPMELNRKDQALPPYKKLKEPNDEKNYKMVDGNALRRDSFIIDEENWLEWKAVWPSEDQQPPPRFLSLEDEEHKGCREALVDAIMTRTVSIYRHWFESLEVGTLFRSVDVRQQQRS